MTMKNRSIRDAERRNFINKMIEENLECVKDDPQSLFSEIQDDKNKEY